MHILEIIEPTDDIDHPKVLARVGPFDDWFQAMRWSREILGDCFVFSRAMSVTTLEEASKLKRCSHLTKTLAILSEQ